MTQEEKQELLVALCGYLPYGLKIEEYNEEYGFNDSELSVVSMKYFADDEASADGYWINRIENIKPYLRPMSSMTEEEKKEVFACISSKGWAVSAYQEIDWLNAHHFDYRGLFEKGLALPAPEDMYNTKTK